MPRKNVAGRMRARFDAFHEPADVGLSNPRAYLLGPSDEIAQQSTGSSRVTLEQHPFGKSLSRQFAEGIDTVQSARELVNEFCFAPTTALAKRAQ